MTLRKLIYLPDERLRRPNAQITHFDNNLQTLIDDMFETMYHENGVGLAAPQIGVNLQLSVIDTIGDRSQQLVLINPQILHAEGEMEYTEGCLSVPGAYEKIIRAKKVTIRAQDRQGIFYEMTAEGLLGECFQHEIDHLNGKLFIDRLSPFKRSLARKKMDKYQKNKVKKT